VNWQAFLPELENAGIKVRYSFPGLKVAVHNMLTLRIL